MENMKQGGGGDQKREVWPPDFNPPPPNPVHA